MVKETAYLFPKYFRTNQKAVLDKTDKTVDNFTKSVNTKLIAEILQNRMASKCLGL